MAVSASVLAWLASAPSAALSSASGDISRLSLNIEFEISYLILRSNWLNNPFVPKLLFIVGPWDLGV